VHRVCASDRRGLDRDPLLSGLPTGAIKLVLADDAELARLAAAEDLEPFKPELKTKPRVLYENLYRWSKVFVSGSAVYKDTDGCAEGARVTVRAGSEKVGEGAADTYGEFVVDKLEARKEYIVTVEAAGYAPYSTTVKPNVSINLGPSFSRKRSLPFGGHERGRLQSTSGRLSFAKTRRGLGHGTIRVDRAKDS